MTKLYNSLFVLVCCAFLSGCGQGSAVEETPEHANHHSTLKEAKELDEAMVIKTQTEPDTLKGSLKAAAHGKIGPAHLTIVYHSPAVRGRVIWGGLVAHKQVWVTDAHSATSLQTDHPITVGGEQLSAGKYALYYPRRAGVDGDHQQKLETAPC